MTTITKERLLKIQQWSETYGAGSNVMLPAEEAEELARIALASLDAEPVAWTDEQELRDVEKDGLGYLFTVNPITPNADHRRVILLYRHAQPAPEREQIRREHAEWSDATFGDVGPVGPLKHLSKEALEAAADPSDPLEWADMQFLLWDSQRRMGISDEFITRAMIEKLAINKTRQWPEPKDGEPRLHIKEQPVPVVPDERAAFNAWNNEDNLPIAGVGAKNAAWLAWQARSSLCGNSALNVPPERPADSSNGDDIEAWFDEGWNACRAAMLQGAEPVSDRDELPVIGWLRSDYNSDDKRDPNAPLFMLGSNDPSEAWGVKYIPFSGNSQVTPDGWISCSERMPAQNDWVLIYSKHAEYLAGQVQGEYVELNDGTLSWLGSALHWMPLPVPPQK
ncbi:DUF550 domain-containing protein [Salmonella enterica]|nr:DUF550 domain-containing protein [Salmonella enterica]